METNTEEQIEYLLQYCHEHKKYASGGTDYHGNNRPSISIGIGKGNLHIQDELINNWIKKE